MTHSSARLAALLIAYSETDVRSIDFVDAGHPALLRMWYKRQRGYRAMGYRVGSEDSIRDLDV